MAIIEVGKIEIEPFKLDTILKLRLKEILNDHAVFHLYARLEKEQADTPLGLISNTTQIKFKGDGEIIFSGVARNIDITCVEDVSYLRIIAVSNTILIDVEKKNRSFQDAAQKYREIVEEVTGEKGSSVTFGDSEAAGKTVDNIILQYAETDWAFVLRALYHRFRVSTIPAYFS